MKKTLLLPFVLLGLSVSAQAQDSTSYNIRATYQGPGKGLAASYLNVPNKPKSTLRLDTSFTIECWIYINAKDSTKEYNLVESYGTNSGIELFVDNGIIKSNFYNTGSTTTYRQASWGTSNKIKFDQWNHVAVGFNSRTGQYHGRYLNGDPLTGKVGLGSHLPLDFQNDFKIGADGVTGFAEADFRIDEIRIWKYLRTATEIKDNYNKCLNGNESNLFAYYTFEGVTDLNDIADKSGNGNKGELKTVSDLKRLVRGAYGCASASALESHTVNVCPNPAFNLLTIENKNKVAKSITVLNLMGKKVMEIQGHQNTIDVSELAEGMYFLHVNHANSIGTSRFIKE